MSECIELHCACGYAKNRLNVREKNVNEEESRSMQFGDGRQARTGINRHTDFLLLLCTDFI